MKDASSNHVLLIGLPNTGKTSYLAALWYMVSQTNLECALSLEKLDGDSKYLNEIREAWLEYRAVTRTLLDSEKDVSMRLKYRGSNQAMTLGIPDLSGESFRLQWTERQFTAGYDGYLRKASGAVMFVHPEGVVKPTRIDTVIDLAEELSSSVPQGGEGVAAAPVKINSWDAGKAPTQVQLVELLQFIASREYVQRPFRLAIVVSAWDVLIRMHETPQEWISGQLPLLAQFLQCNRKTFTVAFYGVSAQGGRYASSLFSASDFRNAGALVRRLQQRSDPISSYVWDQFGEDSQNAIWDGESFVARAPEVIQPLLAKDFNKLMARASIYDRERFAAIDLRQETAALLKTVDSVSTNVQRRQEEMVRLNRLLLEDAYPSAISRARQYDKEVAALLAKLPARRALLVGNEVSNPHDLTEPLQWLTH